MKKIEDNAEKLSAVLVHRIKDDETTNNTIPVVIDFTDISEEAKFNRSSQDKSKDDREKR
ncbi:MAG: hypothetical protein QW478_07435 [Candidatus Micrarchaeaceae archaeon]